MDHMHTIVFYNNKGGIGKTTLSVHLALFASARRIRTMVVCLDRQGDVCRWLAKGDCRVHDGLFFRVNDYLQVLYSPMELPKNIENIDLLIVDCPPAVEVVDKVTADLWVVPLDGRLAMENLGNIHDSLCQADGAIMLVLNRCDLIGKRALEGLRAAARQIPQARLRDEPIPTSAAIAKAAEYFRPVWEVPYGRDTQGDQAIQKLCSEILNERGLDGRI
jgi:cellulose biosynthesis protein BcsQ